MKCPKCGSEMQDGYLYCENCGEEIHIVPDYEPEIEYSMNETISGIGDEVKEEVPQMAEDKLFEEEDTSSGRISRTGIIVTVSLAAFLIIGTITGILLVKNYQNHSADYQMSKAAACFKAGDLDNAIAHYERAAELDETIISVYFAMADLYGQSGMEKEYSDCLSKVIQSPYATEDEVETAYKKLISFYKAKEDYASINTLLMNTEREDIKVMFQNYMALVPEFSHKEGTYEQVLPLKLTSSTQGTIYYTTDGTLPDENSDIYTTPIFLETGSYTISAMFVNEYGIKSDVVARSYVIDVQKPAAPEVETYSGEYTQPTMIRVMVPENTVIYYTTDGSKPTDQSYVYERAIPMPLGKSHFCFVAYNEEGVAGECTDREFELTLLTETTAEQAVDKIKEIMFNTGKIKDLWGTVNGDLPGYFIYQFLYTMPIEGKGDFYIIVEVYRDTDGIQNRTGCVYAVDIYSLEAYELSEGPSEYILEAL